ncbi:hypothetical protein EJ03DRAFT_35076 [Teratosphaeria nubilosa]|uniref:Uncharacterized protein n=1 Tax=Teratosphaeria nubilosa TaxID=161662 RepID=A0A6G1KUZ4_9PEZI|nr:hypothetical protein EJ03DRAFT_35076 [Teratosphaeria nubilosa]
MTAPPRPTTPQPHLASLLTLLDHLTHAFNTADQALEDHAHRTLQIRLYRAFLGRNLGALIVDAAEFRRLKDLRDEALRRREDVEGEILVARREVSQAWLETVRGCLRGGCESLMVFPEPPAAVGVCEESGCRRGARALEACGCDVRVLFGLVPAGELKGWRVLWREFGVVLLLCCVRGGSVVLTFGAARSGSVGEVRRGD